MSLREMFEKAIIANELDGNMAYAYRFTDPDGLRTGKSGYSFGVCQFDIFNNPAATACLEKCGFTPDELARLRSQKTEVKDLNAKLKAHALVIDEWDDVQLEECLRHVQAVARLKGFSYADDFAVVSAADYHNQIFMSQGGRLATFCANLGRPVTGEDIYQVKMSIAWTSSWKRRCASSPCSAPSAGPNSRPTRPAGSGSAWSTPPRSSR